ncbi:hypothetical protein [Mycobacterium sp. 1081908.1]|nr:hypothetical protein [Mycobacterium sp. 1081908.1]
MDFVIQWLWYLLAFLAGSAVARVIANILNKRVIVEEIPVVASPHEMGDE